MKNVTILFDLDGTLIDSTDAIVQSFQETLELYGYDKIDRDEIKKLIGHTLDNMFYEVGVKKEHIKDCVEEYKKRYKKRSLKMTSLLPTAKEAIMVAYSFAKLGIVTTKTGKYSKEILEHLGIMRYFEVLIGREDVVRPKPHNEPIEKALSMMSVSKLDAWMIGDTKLDLISANRANIESIGVLSGYESKFELQQYTRHIKNDALDAIRFIHDKYLL